jgi:outer membrane protein OmpA-like peptidoglycan-associated protein
MKSILLAIGCLALSIGGASAQTGRRSVEATDIRITRTGGQVTVEFTLDAGRRAARAGHNLVIDPVLQGGGTQRRELPSVVIRGRRSEVIDLRHELSGGERHDEPTAGSLRAGESFDYTATVPYESWMIGSKLIFEGASVGCCSVGEIAPELIAANVLSAEPVVDTQVVEIPAPAAASTGESLAMQYPFVAPAADFGPFEQALRNPRQNDLTERAIDNAREGSISVFFAQGVSAVDRNFGDNNRNLVELISVVRALAEADDSRVAAIVIAGFTSPEGGATLNDRLAWNRAVAVKEFLIENTGIDSQRVRVFNGGDDWVGLRELIAHSDIYQRQLLMHIIDYTPVANGERLGELRRVDGGRAWKYMETRFFPQLRQAAYIKVYYENK